MSDISVAFDIGGTFTDVVSLDHTSGRLRSTKILTTPTAPAAAGLQGISELLNRDVTPSLANVVHATTLVTNAVIERRGARVGLITTEGFRDVLEMRKEQRYDVYDLFITLPEPLVPRHLRLGVRERMAANGTPWTPLDEGGLVAALRKLVVDERVDAIAIAFLHSYKNASHEQRAREIAESEFPGLDVSISSEVAPEIGEFARVSTTVVNAYVRGIVREYLQELAEGLDTLDYKAPFSVMLSAGGITDRHVVGKFPVRMMESGPAAGVLAAVYYAKLLDIEDVLSFDMGGTTAKFAVLRGRRPEIVGEFETGRVHRFKSGSGIPVRIPVIDMMEIGAGGGSIARLDRLGLLKVGPDSSGAEPGPACYDRGGTHPTVTDADVVLGYVDPEYFLGGRERLRPELAVRAIESDVCEGLRLGVVESAWGIYRVVSETMAAAARVHMAERGCNPLNFVMVAFGGAGPVHACSLAEALQVSRIVCPPDSGVASALGLLVAPTAVDLSHSGVVRLESVNWSEIVALYEGMKVQAAEMLGTSGGGSEWGIAFEASVDVRNAGQFFEFNLSLPWGILERGDGAAVAGLFRSRYEELYGRSNVRVPIELVNWRLRGVVPGRIPDTLIESKVPRSVVVGRLSARTRSAWFGSEAGFVQTPIHRWADLSVEDVLEGPAIVEQDGSTVVIRPGWSAQMHERGALSLERRAVSAREGQSG
jgi:N-methylhydantoinase A